ALGSAALAGSRTREQRAAALWSLGLIAAARSNASVQSAVLATLAAAARGGALEDAELGVPLVCALGMLHPAAAAERALVHRLLPLALERGDPRDDSRLVAAHALTALAALAKQDEGEGDRVREWCRAAIEPGLRSRTGNRDVARAAALALGAFGRSPAERDADDELLRRVWSDHPDPQVRAF